MIGAHLAAINQNSLISYNTCPDIAIHALHRITYVYYVILLINNFTGIYICNLLRSSAYWYPPTSRGIPLNLSKLRVFMI